MRTSRLKITALVIYMLSGCFALLCTAQTPSKLARPIGMDALAQPEYLPLLYSPGTQTLQFCSYDLTGGNVKGMTGGNDDGDFLNSFTKYIDSRGEYVIFDSYGPGTLYRQQINIWLRPAPVTMSLEATPGAGESRIRYYFDDESKPRIDLTVDEFFGGKHPPFDAPFAFEGSWKDYEGSPKLPPVPPFANQYYPLPYAQRLKVTFVPTAEFKKNMGTDVFSWYQFTYLQYPVGTPVVSWTQDPPSSSRVRAEWGEVGTDPKPSGNNKNVHSEVAVQPGGVETLLDFKGQAAIASLKLRMTPYSEDTFYKARIRMTWDADRGEGGFELPIGVFFGGGAEEYPDRSQIPHKQLKTLLYGFDGQQSTFYSYWPMPFWSSAKIEIINDSATSITLSADIGITPKEQLNYPQDGAGYFFAKETRFADSGDDLFARAFREEGFGHIVGTSFYSQDYSTDGDTFIYFDGSRTPQIHGDGTEDDNNQGWGGTSYQKPLWGGVVSGIQGAYRIYLGDSLVFDDQAKINFEYSRLEASPIAKTDVTVYYYKGKNSFRPLALTDAVDVGIPGSEKAHDYVIEGQSWAGSLRSAYDGYEKNVEAGSFLEEGRAFNGKSAFTVAVDPTNEGVRLRRLLSRLGNGVQTAEVWVDGVKVDRPWHVVFSSSATENQAWVDSDFEIPASLTRKKSKLRIEIKHLSSTKGEINEFHYWVWCHMPPWNP